MESFLLLPLLLFLSTTSAASPFPPGSLPTSSGYLPISPNSTAALFYAFYEAQHPTTPLSSTPLLVWLQGGPGCSSLKANLLEFGPFLLSPTLRPNPYSWNRHFGLLFIENPLGVGFSTAPSPDLIPRDQPTVARHLFAALQSFLSSNPSFRRRPIFLTGSSYGGKYIPVAGYHILTQNPHLPLSDRINLAGVAIGNGMTHPVTQVTTHAATAYYAGLINDRQRTHLESLQSEAVSLIDSCNWSAAADTRIGLLKWLQNVTGLATMFDITKLEPYDFGVVGEFLNKEEVKAALGVREGAGWERCSADVRSALHEDLMKSVKYGVEELVRKSRVLLYQGVYDLHDGVASTKSWVRRIIANGSGDHDPVRVGSPSNSFLSTCLLADEHLLIGHASCSFDMSKGISHLVLSVRSIPCEAPDEAQKDVEEGGGELMYVNTGGAILEAVRQVVLDQVRPLLDQAVDHTSETNIFASNVHYQSTPEGFC